MIQEDRVSSNCSLNSSNQQDRLFFLLKCSKTQQDRLYKSSTQSSLDSESGRKEKVQAKTLHRSTL